MAFKLRWESGGDQHVLKIRPRQEGVIFYEEDGKFVVSFTDYELFDFVEWPPGADVREYITWAEVRISASRLSDVEGMIEDLRNGKIARIHWTVTPEGRRFPYYYQIPTLPQVLWNAAVGLFFMTESFTRESKDIIWKIRNR